MSDLLTAQGEDRAIATCFGDSAWLGALVRIEVALARAQAKVGLIPTKVSDVIAERASTFAPDLGRLAAATARDGFPILGLIEQLRAHVGGEAAKFVHWGATTQDIWDTALTT